MSVRILIADQHKIVRDGISALLRQEPEFEVVGDTGSGRAAVEMTREHSPEVVIIDVSLPDLNGIEATRQIAARAPLVKVIALSMHADHRCALEMFEAGAAGYLLKDCSIEELTRAIRTVISEETYISPAVARAVMQEYVRHVPRPDLCAYSVLTVREREVLQLMAEGVATKDIASRLNVSKKTVETHRQHIMEKLELRTVAELTKYAVREGLTSL